MLSHSRRQRKQANQAKRSRRLHSPAYIHWSAHIYTRWQQNRRQCQPHGEAWHSANMHDIHPPVWCCHCRAAAALQGQLHQCQLALLTCSAPHQHAVKPLQYLYNPIDMHGAWWAQSTHIDRERHRVQRLTRFHWRHSLHALAGPSLFLPPALLSSEAPGAPVLDDCASPFSYSTVTPRLSFCRSARQQPCSQCTARAASSGHE